MRPLWILYSIWCSLKHANTDSVQYLQQLEARKQTLQILYSIWRLHEACKQTLQILYSLKHADTGSVQYLGQLEAGKHSRFCAVFVLYSIWRQIEACNKHCRFCTVSEAASSMQTNTADSVQYLEQFEACKQTLPILYSLKHANKHCRFCTVFEGMQTQQDQRKLYGFMMVSPTLMTQ